MTNSPRTRLILGCFLATLLALTLGRAVRAQTSGSAEAPESSQKKSGSRWIQNYLDLPYAATLVTLIEMIGSPSSQTSQNEQSAPGYLERNKGYFAPEIIQHFKENLPLIAFDFPQDILEKLPPPSPPSQNDDPFLSTAKTKEGITSWDDFLSDVRLSNFGQAFQVFSTLQQRKQEHEEALNNQLRDGGGRFAVIADGNSKGIGGQNLGRYAVHAGDVKAAVEQVAIGGLVEQALIQDPGTQTATDPAVPLPAQFVPSPAPPRSGALAGGSNAAPAFAQTFGLLPSTDPFGPFASLDPSVLISPITGQVQELLGGAGSIPNALNQFGGASQLGDLMNIFGDGRTRDLLGTGGGGSPAPPTVSGAEDPACPRTTANRSEETVVNAARLLRLPPAPQWTIAFLRAASLFGIRGTDNETQQLVTIQEELFPSNACVWIVAAGGGDAVFLDDARPVVFRLINLGL